MLIKLTRFIAFELNVCSKGQTLDKIDNLMVILAFEFFLSSLFRSKMTHYSSEAHLEEYTDKSNRKSRLT